MNGVIIATVVVGVTGLILGIFLCYFSEKFAVPVDEKEAEVREALPGNNCGGCGFAGCDGLAAAIAKGEAPVNGCPVGGEPVARVIGKIMGVDVKESVRRAAYVRCLGNCEIAKKSYEYTGPEECALAARTPGGGGKACIYGCLGFGDCVKACQFGAIDIVDGIAVINQDACKACTQCVAACPRSLIEMVPVTAREIVSCRSEDPGKDVMKVCGTGCIGCGICVKQCEFGAVTVKNHLAYIDQDKCTHCGKCAEKCPKKVIKPASASEALEA